MTIAETGPRLRTREISCKDLVEQALSGAERDRRFNAFITVTADQAVARARELDRELSNGKDRGPLHGIPVGFKDLFFTKGVTTTDGSKLFADFTPDYDATVVAKMEAAGAISVGKLNMHECAYGITSSNPHYGAVRNPHNPDCIPGGSSGGSGVAVATGTIFCGMGSDTGGSIRIPASFCGVVGLKATFGRVSRHGCFPLGLSLDHMGPLTRSVRDAALVLNAIAGPDGHDEACSHRPVEDYVPGEDASLQGKRVGLPENFYTDKLDTEMREAFNRAASLAESQGARIVPVRIPDPEGLIAVARVILLAEASAVMQPHWNRREDFGPDVLTLFDQGRLVPATQYVNAQRVRREMIRNYAKLFDGIDVLFTPTTPMAAPRIGQTTVRLGDSDEDTRLSATRFMRGINVLGNPALSIPCGWSSTGLPFGLQLVGRPWGERMLLDCGAAMERALMPAVARSPAASV